MFSPVMIEEYANLSPLTVLETAAVGGLDTINSPIGYKTLDNILGVLGSYAYGL